jgi:hypothetical protein
MSDLERRDEAVGVSGFARHQRLPTSFQLGAAVRAASVLSSDGTRIVDARDSYLSLPTGGVYRHTDLGLGERLLLGTGVLHEHGDTLYPTPEALVLARLPEREGCEFLLEILLERHPPIWLSTIEGVEGVALEYVPDTAREVLETLVGGAASQSAFLRRVASKVNPELNAETGRLAEEHVAELCRAQLRECGRNDLADQVVRISLFNDAAGYDVAAPRVDLSTRHLEVKGTRGAEGPTRVYISRNEVERAQVDPDWTLAVCRVDDCNGVTLMGCCDISAFVDELPIDRPGCARWASARLDLSVDLLAPALPSVSAA